jgi:hypothetical protein
MRRQEKNDDSRDSFYEELEQVFDHFPNISTSSIIFCGQVAVKLLASHVMHVASVLNVYQSTAPEIHKVDGQCGSKAIMVMKI